MRQERKIPAVGGMEQGNRLMAKAVDVSLPRTAPALTTDEKLYRKHSLTQNEIAFIESMIRPMETKERMYDFAEN
jgi:hypothetical protein